MDLRMPEINDVRIAGRLTRDAEVRHTQNDRSVATFGIAASESYKDHSGQRKETVTFVDCEYWQPADYILDHLKKGYPIIVEGQLRLNEYEDNEGKTQRRTRVRVRRIHLLGWLPKEDQEREPSTSQPSRSPNPEPEQPVMDDDIPF